MELLVTLDAQCGHVGRQCGIKKRFRTRGRIERLGLSASTDLKSAHRTSGAHACKSQQTSCCFYEIIILAEVEVSWIKSARLAVSAV